MNAFVKKEPIAAPGPALVIGGSEDVPPAEDSMGSTPATVTLSGDQAAPIARDYSVGDTFDATGSFTVKSIGEDGSCELEMTDLAPSSEPDADDSAEGAIDDYLKNKGGSSADEELA